MKPVFDTARSILGPLEQAQVDGMNATLDAWVQYGDGDNRKLSYVLATGTHESKFKPISENLTYSSAARIHAVWPTRFPTVESAKPYIKSAQKLANKVYGGRLGNTEPDDGWDYRGRGPAQLTGKENYKKFSDLLGVDLVENPDFAKSPTYAGKILVVGLMKGMFTGKKLGDYINASGTDYINARRCVNADVQANGRLIAGYATQYEEALQSAPKPIPVEPVKHLGPDHTPPDNPLPIDIPDADPIVTEPKSRNPFGWVLAAAFLVLFLIAIFVAFVPMW